MQPTGGGWIAHGLAEQTDRRIALGTQNPRSETMNHTMRWAVLIGTLAFATSCEAPDADTPEPAEPGEPVASAEPDVRQEIDWAPVDAAMGRSGAPQAGGEYRFNMPRTDLTVTVDGVQIRPALALGSWVAFMPTGANEAVVMGDLVLTDGEYNAVISRLHEGGIGQTAVHKHLPEHSPDLWWTHVHGRGDPVQLARTIQQAIAETGTPPAAPSAATPPPLDLDTAQIRQVLGRAGNANGGIYNVSFGRAETVRAGGIEVPPAMGMATVMNFQPTGGGGAVINGDFSMLPGEVDSVVRTLRENGIEVVSIHNHTTDEEPRLVFTHFWGNGDAVALARGLRGALDHMNVQR